MVTKHQDIEAAKQQIQLQMAERLKEAENETSRQKNLREKQVKHERKLEGNVTQKTLWNKHVQQTVTIELICYPFILEILQIASL